MKNVGKLFIATGFLPALGVSSIQAQPVIEEITVTATKRGAVSVQDFVGGIRALTAETLDANNLRSMEDFSRFEPSLQFATQGEGDLQLIIRGIQSPGAGTVGVYFDETVITGANFQDGGGRTPDVGAYDIERIEILKGPQGTLFGASSMSGTVRLITNKPDTEAFDASISIQGSDTNEGGTGYGVDAMINIPLVDDQLALRGVFWQQEKDGYIDHIVGINGNKREDANELEKTGGRLMLKWTPNDALTINAYAQRQETEVDGAQHFQSFSSGVLEPINVIVAPVPPAGPFPGEFGELTTTTPAQERWDDEFTMYGITAEYDLGFGSLLATVSKTDRDMFVVEDTTATAISFGFPPAFFAPAIGSYNIHQFQERETMNAEVRFSSNFEGPLNFVAGGFYQDDETETELNILAGNPDTGVPVCSSRSACIADPALAAQALAFARDQKIDYEFFALFTHVDYQLTDKWAMGAGVRYFESEQDNLERTLQAFQGSLAFTIPPLFGGPIQTVPTVSVDNSVDEEEITYDFSLSYQHSEEQMYYFKAATGFRQGGINDSSTASAFGLSIPVSFESDELLSLEMGAKTTWMGGRLILNAAVFKMFWDDIQVPGVEATGAIEFIANAGEAEIDGIELEIFARPTDNWFLSFGATWLDAALTKDQDVDPALGGGTAGRDGDDIPRVPEWALSGSAEYTLPFEILNDVETTLRANFSYTGESDTFFNSSFPGFTEIGGYTLVDLSANFSYENWDLRVYATNVGDKRAKVDVSNSEGPDGVRVYTVQPRTVGVQLKWRFK